VRTVKGVKKANRVIMNREESEDTHGTQHQRSQGQQKGSCSRECPKRRLDVPVSALSKHIRLIGENHDVSRPNNVVHYCLCLRLRPSPDAFVRVIHGDGHVLDALDNALVTACEPTRKRIWEVGMSELVLPTNGSACGACSVCCAQRSAVSECVRMLDTCRGCAQRSTVSAQ
jgi:hypothetical protein